MTSYLFDIGSKRRKVARFIGRVRDELARAFVDEKIRTGTTQVALAEKLGIDKSIVSRQLKGEQNLTLRSIAEFAWATDHDIEFRLVRKGKAYVTATRVVTTEAPKSTQRTPLKVSSRVLQEA